MGTGRNIAAGVTLRWVASHAGGRGGEGKGVWTSEESQETFSQLCWCLPFVDGNWLGSPLNAIPVSTRSKTWKVVHVGKEFCTTSSHFPYFSHSLSVSFPLRSFANERLLHRLWEDHSLVLLLWCVFHLISLDIWPLHLFGSNHMTMTLQ